LDIAAPNTCAAILASVESVPIGVALGAAAVPATGGFPGALIGAGVGIGAYLLYRENLAVSPN
jgi:hypothetical protein